MEMDSFAIKPMNDWSRSHDVSYIAHCTTMLCYAVLCHYPKPMILFRHFGSHDAANLF